MQERNDIDNELLERQKQFEKDLAQSEYIRDKLSTINRDHLTSGEKIIYDKIMNREQVTDDEFQVLYKYISDYDYAIHEIKPDEVISGKTHERELIRTEKELIDFFDNDYIEFNFAPRNLKGERIMFTIHAKPIDDSRMISMVEEHESLFQNYTPDQLEVTQKQARGEKLTRAEQQILNDLAKELDGDNSYTERYNQMKQLIIDTCTIILANGETIQFTRNLIDRFRFNDVISLYMKLEDVLGLGADSNEKLFPTG